MDSRTDGDAYYLLTGDENLDEILAMDVEESEKRGILCERGRPGSSPVILILGAPGTGKTTLALQIATTIAKKPDTPEKPQCSVFFYSMEQPAESLQAVCKSFGFEGQLVNLEEVDIEVSADDAVRICHFAPLPLSGQVTSTAFEDRFSQLCHMLSEVDHHRNEADHSSVPVFFIDSLNASATSIERVDIHRLCALFRSHEIPVFITAERHEPGTPAADLISEPARFLADIVIELTRDQADAHVLQYLEVSKSRVRRQALGRHLYKIRTGKSEGEDRNGGVVVYRSMPCVLSTIREHRERESINTTYVLCAESGGEGDPKDGLYSLLGQSEVKAGSCFALLGPPGTHKLALAMNIAAGYVSKPEKKQKLLLISFGGYDPIPFEGVAWFPSRLSWAGLTHGKDAKPRPKWWTIEFDSTARPGGQSWGGPTPSATQLILRLGHLTPEELLDRVDRITRDGSYSAVVLSDTAEICTGFPLLRKDPLFLPALIDLFHERGLVSVCIGVQTESDLNRDMDFALQSSADYRMSLAHYPNVYELAKGIAVAKMADANPCGDSRESGQPEGNLDDQGPKASSRPQQQWVNVIVDNVSGKHYSREPKWLDVKDPGDKGPTKELFCGTWDQLQAWRTKKGGR